MSRTLRKGRIALTAIATAMITTGCFGTWLGSSFSSSFSSSPSTQDFSGTDASHLPLGDGHRSPTTPAIGSVFSCQATFNGTGAQTPGPWIEGNFWDSTAKVSVQGSVSWASSSRYSEFVIGSARTIVTAGVPTRFNSGIFPVATTDPAYQYDRNPVPIAANLLSLTIPSKPVLANTPSCLGMGAIGYFKNGVAVFNALDAAGRDAGANEIQDGCGGHPERTSMYHYHDVSSCFIDQTANGTSTLIGYALDGFGIYVSKDSNGTLPSNSDLDVCHGRTSTVKFDNVTRTMYHYEATLEYPYTIGCFKGVR